MNFGLCMADKHVQSYRQNKTFAAISIAYMFGIFDFFANPVIRTDPSKHTNRTLSSLENLFAIFL